MLLSASSIIEKSIQLYREHWKVFIGYALLFLVPSVGSAVVSSLALTQIIANNFFITTAQLIPFIFVRFLFSTIVGTWVSIIFLKVILDTYQQKERLSINELFIWSLKHVLSAVIASFIFLLVLFGSSLFFIIPAIILSVFLTFYLLEIVANGRKAIDSLRASYALVSGKWFDVFWRLLVPGFFFLLLITLLEGVFTFPFDFNNGPAAKSIASFIINIITIVTAPLIGSSIVILYAELTKYSPTTELPETDTQEMSSV